MIGFVFHILGYPYGLSTNKAVSDAIDANLDVKRRIYGKAFSGSTFFADTVPTFDLLEMPNNQTIGVDSNSGKLKGGNWTARVSNQELGYIWPHRISPAGADNTTVKVLDGLVNVPSVNYDETISWGELDAQFNGSQATTSLRFNEDIGTDLEDKIDNRNSASDFCTLFIGNETVMTTSTTTVGSEYKSVTVVRGAYKSKIETHAIEEFDSATPLIADAPLNGAAGRYYELYMLEIDDDTGALLDDPVLFRFGQIQNDISVGRTWIEISCGSITSAIEKEITLDTRPSHFSRYILSRPEVGCRNVYNYGPTPHLWISENYQPPVGIWLCGPGDTVTFDTVEDVLEAIQEELNYCSAGSTSQQSGSTATVGHDDEYIDLTMDYLVTNNGIYYSNPGVLNLAQPRMGGLLPWLLGLVVFDTSRPSTEDIVSPYLDLSDFWGFVAGNDVNNYNWHKKYNHKANDSLDIWTGAMETVLFDEVFQSITNIENWGLPVKNIKENETVDLGVGATTDEVKPTGTARAPYSMGIYAKYIIMPPWDLMGFSLTVGEDYWPWWKFNKERGFDRPLPTNLYLEPLSDAFRYSELVLSLGREGDQEYSTIYCSNAPTNDGIAISGNDFGVNKHNFDVYSGINVFAMSSSWINYTLNIYKPLYWFDCPLVDHDPHEINIVSTFQGKKASSVFKGLLGDNTDVDVPYRYRFDSIPWLIDDDREDFQAIIDWDSYDELVKPFLGGHQYRVSLIDGDFNFGKSFWNELAFHGVQPTYELDYKQKQWMIRFRKIGLVDKTKAVWEGRTLDQSNMISNNSESFDLVGSNVATKVTARCNFSNDGYGVEFVVNNKGAKKVSSSTEVSVESKMSYLLNAGDLRSNPAYYMQIQNTLFSRILRAYVSPRYEYSTNVALSEAWNVGVGLEALLTDDTVINALTGDIGFSDQPVVLSSVGYDFSNPKAKIKLKYKLETSAEYTTAPSMLVSANNSTKNASRVVITPETHTWSDSIERVDMSWFDCLNYARTYSDDSGDAENYTARSCSCGDYGALAVQLGVAKPVPIAFEVKNLDIDAGTCELWGTTTSWDTTKAYVVIYTKWNSADTQDCQRSFLCLSGRGGTLIDDGAVETKGHRAL